MSTNQRLAMPILQPINTLHFCLLSRMFYRPMIRLMKRPHAKEHACVGGITIGPRNSAVGRVKVMARYAWWHCSVTWSHEESEIDERVISSRGCLKPLSKR